MFSNRASESASGKVRVSLKHPAEQRPHIVLIEHHELSSWIQHARRHGFALQAESIDPSDLPHAA